MTDEKKVTNIVQQLVKPFSTFYLLLLYTKQTEPARKVAPLYSNVAELGHFLKNNTKSLKIVEIAKGQEHKVENGKNSSNSWWLPICKHSTDKLKLIELGSNNYTSAKLVSKNLTLFEFDKDDVLR